MPRGLLLALGLLISGLGVDGAVFSIALAADPKSGWGHVSGRVVFEGDLSDPKVQRLRGEQPIYEPRSIEESLRGVKRRVLRTRPNQQLLIEDKSRGVANVFVYLSKRPEQIHPDFDQQRQEPLEVTFRDDQFHPHVLLTRVGQTVRLTSTEGNVNYHVLSTANREINPMVSPTRPGSWSATKPEPVPIVVNSTIHPGAASYWLVADHPYAVLTNADGSFRIENLPAGNFQLKIWHELVGYVGPRVSGEIASGETTQLEPVGLTLERLGSR